MKISFVGAGNVATNLGALLASAGHNVVYSTPNPKEGQISITQAIASGEVVCFAIPYDAMKDVLTSHKEALEGKIVVDITNAINLEDWSPLMLGEDNSGGEETASLLPNSKVVKAFNTIFADVMKSEKQQHNGEKLVAFIASDDEEAANVVKGLADDAGFNGVVVAGGLKNARYLEAIAHMNIAIALGGGGTDAGLIYVQR
ncbi:MAG: NAD(P)-binding domain-containing protein [Bacteroidota bacterium]